MVLGIDLRDGLRYVWCTNSKEITSIKNTKSVALLLTGAVLGASLASPDANAAAPHLCGRPVRGASAGVDQINYSKEEGDVPCKR